jgi:hypothetical protein
MEVPSFDSSMHGTPFDGALAILSYRELLHSPAILWPSMLPTFAPHMPPPASVIVFLAY